jgi:1-phosphofructokinase family hexose kinase
MILSVTLNPCLDKTLTVQPWKPGDNVRGASLREVVGGKGNNVARALKRLGHAARPATFLGGMVGRHCEDLLREQDGLDPIVVSTQAHTRVILTVRTETNEQTAFFDPDPAITDAEADALHKALEAVVKQGGVEAMTLSGSSPSPATHGLYSDLISLARSRRIPVFLDTYGPALDGIWGFWPDVMQLNRREAAAFLRVPSASDLQVVQLLADWARHKVKIGVVTDGPHAVLARCGNTTYRMQPPAITPVNPIGSGDCLLAGLVDGWLKRLEPEETLRRAVATAVANALVWDAGAISPEEVDRIAQLVKIEAA